MRLIQKRSIWMVAVALFGIAMIALAIKDETASGMLGVGVGLTTVAVLKLIELWRVTRNPEKLKKYNLLQNEERYIAIAEKSGRFALMLSLFGELALAGVLTLMGNAQSGYMITCLAGIQTLIYLVCYWYFASKM